MFCPVCWLLVASITKTCLCSFDPIKPHFYIVKLVFTGYTWFFLFLLKNIDCGCSLEPPHRGGSNEYPQAMFWAEIWKNNRLILSESFNFLVVKFSIHLNRHFFVMWWVLPATVITSLAISGWGKMLCFLVVSSHRCFISVFLWFLCSRSCYTDELETFQADWTNVLCIPR